MNDRIVIDPKVCHGKPVMRGTRLPVALVVGSLAGGMTFEDVQREYGISLGCTHIHAAHIYSWRTGREPRPRIAVGLIALLSLLRGTAHYSKIKN
jgi:uncharacterized protein (DUF433 family)